MCQLLGMNCAQAMDATFSFTGFALRGGGTDEHSDGFGAAFFEGRSWRLFVDHRPSFSSPLAAWIKANPIHSKNVIAHIRKATRGGVSVENSHPFSRELWGRQWIFAHNGTLHGFEPPLDGPYAPIGQTDSEWAFCWILQSLRERFDRPPSPELLFEALIPLAARASEYGRFNFLMSCGDFLIAHCSDRLYHLERSWPFSQARLVDQDLSIDFSKITSPADRVCFIATAPLTLDEPWVAFAPGEMILFRDGAPIARALRPAAAPQPSIDLALA